MRISVVEAAEMYARASYAWYGSKALKIADEQVHRYRRRGDATGLCWRGWTGFGDGAARFKFASSDRAAPMGARRSYVERATDLDGVNFRL